MLLISNNVGKWFPYPPDAIIRINLAWETIESAKNIMNNNPHQFFIDYPSGRTKPPTPKMSLMDAVRLCRDVKPAYFAFSNAENPELCEMIRDMVPKETLLVPKIETKKGVDLMAEILQSSQTDTVMYDREDMFASCTKEEFETAEHRLDFWNTYINHVNKTAEVGELQRPLLKILRLGGVVFHD